jgi:alkanesulfonate monooxygenase
MDRRHFAPSTGVAVIFGETHEEAERKLQEATSLWPIEVALANLHIDFGDVDIDSLFPETYDPKFSRGRAAAIASYARANGLTIRQTAERCSIGLGHRPLVGTAQSIADDLESWLDAEATDGFAVIQPLLLKGLKISPHMLCLSSKDVASSEKSIVAKRLERIWEVQGRKIDTRGTSGNTSWLPRR